MSSLSLSVLLTSSLCEGSETSSLNCPYRLGGCLLRVFFWILPLAPRLAGVEVPPRVVAGLRGMVFGIPLYDWLIYCGSGLIHAFSE